MQRHRDTALVLPRDVVAEPGDDAREGRVAARDAEEGAEVLDAEGDVGDVDGEADGEHREAHEDEGRAHLELVRVVGEGEEDEGCGWARGGLVSGGYERRGRDVLAKTYGGTVRSCVMGVSKPNLRIVQVPSAFARSCYGMVIIPFQDRPTAD